jgi:hypothetical protein
MEWYSPLTLSLECTQYLSQVYILQLQNEGWLLAPYVSIELKNRVVEYTCPVFFWGAPGFWLTEESSKNWFLEPVWKPIENLSKLHICICDDFLPKTWIKDCKLRNKIYVGHGLICKIYYSKAFKSSKRNHIVKSLQRYRTE